MARDWSAILEGFEDSLTARRDLAKTLGVSLSQVHQALRYRAGSGSVSRWEPGKEGPVPAIYGRKEVPPFPRTREDGSYWPDELKVFLRQAIGNGMSSIQIAHALKVEHHRVIFFLKKLDITNKS
jgi:hypothetical protein